MCASSGRRTTVAALLLAIALLAGCDKEVKLTFINTTAETRDLYLTAPSHGTRYLGVLPATGGKLKYKLKIDEDLLPATCSWEAGNRSDSFTVNKESEGKMTIAIDPTGNITIDKKTTVHRTDDVTVEDIIVEQKEVVE